jgi:hypothetical protein
VDTRKTMELVRFCSERPRFYLEIAEHCQTTVRNVRRWIDYVESNLFGLKVARRYHGRRVMVYFEDQPKLSGAFRQRDLLQIAALDRAAVFLEGHGRARDAHRLRETIEQMIAHLPRASRQTMLARLSRLEAVEHCARSQPAAPARDNVLLEELRAAAMFEREVSLCVNATRMAGRIVELRHDSQHGWQVVLTGGMARLADVENVAGVEDLTMLATLAA